MTFAATANAIVYTGASRSSSTPTPRPATSTRSCSTGALTTLRSTGRRVAAIVPVDLLGKCADYAAIEPGGSAGMASGCSPTRPSRWAPSRQVARPGSFGDAAVLSFNGNKIMTTSGGGMLLDRRRAIWPTRARYLSTQAHDSRSPLEHTEVGYNYRLSNVLAALGRAQLRRLDEHDRAAAERATLRETHSPGYRRCQSARPADDSDDNCWLTAILVDGSRRLVGVRR